MLATAVAVGALAVDVGALASVAVYGVARAAAEDWAGPVELAVLAEAAVAVARERARPAARWSSR